MKNLSLVVFLILIVQLATCIKLNRVLSFSKSSLGKLSDDSKNLEGACSKLNLQNNNLNAAKSQNTAESSPVNSETKTSAEVLPTNSNKNENSTESNLIIPQTHPETNSTLIKDQTKSEAARQPQNNTEPSSGKTQVPPGFETEVTFNRPINFLSQAKFPSNFQSNTKKGR
jgi:hypothetical protein